MAFCIGLILNGRWEGIKLPPFVFIYALVWLGYIGRPKSRSSQQMGLRIGDFCNNILDDA